MTECVLPLATNVFELVFHARFGDRRSAWMFGECSVEVFSLLAPVVCASSIDKNPPVGEVAVRESGIARAHTSFFPGVACASAQLFAEPALIAESSAPTANCACALGFAEFHAALKLTSWLSTASKTEPAPRQNFPSVAL